MKFDVYRHRPKILLVDDSPIYIRYFIELLEERGCIVEVMTDGLEALATLEDINPDLILLDVVMPGIDGFQLCQKIRENEIFDEVPIIFLTGDNEVKSIIKGFKSGGQDYITKPFNEFEFLLRIETHLRLRIQTEKKLEDNLARLSVLFDFYKKTSEKLDMNSLINATISSLKDNLLVDAVAFFIIEYEPFIFRYHSSSGITSKQELDLINVDFGKKQIGVELSKGKAQYLNFIELPEDKINPVFLNLGFTDAYVQPVISNGEIVGALAIANKDRKNISKGYQDLVMAVCGQLGTAIKNVQLFTALNFELIERKKIQEELIAAKERAECANTAKSQFLTNMSHEIRTPLNGIIGMSQLMLVKDMTKKEKLENTKIIISCANNLLQLVNSVLDFSKIEAEKMDLKNEIFNIEDLVRNSISMHMSKASEKDISISYNLQNKLAHIWNGDRIRLQQVINNLISNAVKFTQKGKIEVSVSIKAEAVDQAELLFSVVDTGIGINKDNIENIFEAFIQVDSSYTRKYSGTGLGLSIAKKLIELMGGQVWVDSELGVGSKFNFTVKLAKVKDFLNEKSDILQERGYIKNVKNKNVLLVEDDKTNQKVVLKILDYINLNVDVANDGYEAIERVKMKKYDLILMDIQMTGMDGITATQKIREFEQLDNKQTPIIAVTAHALKGDGEKFIAHGMDGYLTKPFLIEDLLSIIAFHIDMDGNIDENINFINRVIQNKNERENKRKNKIDFSVIDEYCNNLGISLEDMNQKNAEKFAYMLKENLSRFESEDIKHDALSILMEIRKGNFEIAKKYYDLLIEKIKEHKVTN